MSVNLEWRYPHSTTDLYELTMAAVYIQCQIISWKTSSRR